MDPNAETHEGDSAPASAVEREHGESADSAATTREDPGHAGPATPESEQKPLERDEPPGGAGAAAPAPTVLSPVAESAAASAGAPPATASPAARGRPRTGAAAPTSRRTKRPPAKREGEDTGREAEKPKRRRTTRAEGGLADTSGETGAGPPATADTLPEPAAADVASEPAATPTRGRRGATPRSAQAKADTARRSAAKAKAPRTASTKAAKPPATPKSKRKGAPEEGQRPRASAPEAPPAEERSPPSPRPATRRRERPVDNGRPGDATRRSSTHPVATGLDYRRLDLDKPATGRAGATDPQGAPPAGAPPSRARPDGGAAADARVEHCEIAWWRGYVKSEFYAEAVRPDGSRYEAARSPTFWWRKSDPPPQTDAAAAAHQALVDRLVRAGWQPEGRGFDWYELTFRRALAPGLVEQVPELGFGSPER